MRLMHPSRFAYRTAVPLWSSADVDGQGIATDMSGFVVHFDLHLVDAGEIITRCIDRPDGVYRLAVAVRAEVIFLVFDDRSQFLETYFAVRRRFHDTHVDQRPRRAIGIHSVEIGELDLVAAAPASDALQGGGVKGSAVASVWRDCGA